MGDVKDVPVDRGWRLIMTDLGLDVTQVLRAAELPEGLFALEDARLSVREYFRLWSAFAERIPDPAFPVRFGEAMTVEAFHPMVFAALAAGTSSSRRNASLATSGSCFR